MPSLPGHRERNLEWSRDGRDVPDVRRHRGDDLVTEIRFSWPYVVRLSTWAATVVVTVRAGGWPLAGFVLFVLVATVITTALQIRQIQDQRKEKAGKPLCDEGLHVWPSLEAGVACVRCGEKIPKEAKA